MTITSLSQLDPTQQYTYADYLTWKIEDERLKIELFDGYIQPWYSIYPAHSLLLGGIINGLYPYFRKHSTHEAYQLLLDVRLTNDSIADDKITDVVQPDFIITPKSTLDDAGVVGVPTVLFEIYHSETAHRKMFEKFAIYEFYAVNELWLIDLPNKSGRIYAINSSKKYELVRSFSENDTQIPLVSFPDLSVNFKEIVENIDARFMLK
jgi:Uma2 family endonuclease